MDARNLLSLSGVLLVLGAAGYYWGLGHQKETLPNAEQAQRPDYVVTGISSLETDAQGRLLRRLQAEEMRHYDMPRDESRIERPVFILYQGGQEAWQVTARRGIGFRQNTQVRLEGGVHAERRMPDALPVTFDTPVLYVYPREERLATRANVTIKTPRGSLASRGLEASTRTGDLLLNDVTGNYAPATR